MHYPSMQVPKRKRYRIGRFYGLNCRDDAPEGSFRSMENGSSADAPLFRVRRRRTSPEALDGNPCAHLLAIGGTGVPVLLDQSGTIWSGGRCCSRVLPHRLSFSLRPEEAGTTAQVLDAEALRAALPLDGIFRFTYDRDAGCWQRDDGSGVIPDGAIDCQPQPDDGEGLEIQASTVLLSSARRSMVFLGGWVCIFPDGVYVNAARLHEQQSLEPDVDYGAINVENNCAAGRLYAVPCDIDGVSRSVIWADVPPDGGLWVDTSAETPTVSAWSQSDGLWKAVQPYIRLEAPGIARGLAAGDAVDFVCRLNTEVGGEDELTDALNGTAILTAAWHDPGASGRPAGTNDYVVLPGLVSQPRTIFLTGSDNSFLTLRRKMPEMDYVVECQNRLWGCRWGGGVNELYGSSLGSFKNWSVFEGLSTDSYRVSRGVGGAFTGAAVLGGCPLFFRADSLEKIYPSAGGDHGVVTVSLEGIAPGSARSAVVIRDKLYYRSPGGFCCYSGSLPVRISDPLGKTWLGPTSAGALGQDYYAAVEDERGMNWIYVYHTETGLWDRQDLEDLYQCLSWNERLYYLAGPGQPLRCIGEALDSDGLSWRVETGPLGPVLCTKRYVSRIQVEGRLDPGAFLRVWGSYDGESWVRLGTFRSSQRRTELFPVFPRRCENLRLRLEGAGGMELAGISWLLEPGSDS